MKARLSLANSKDNPNINCTMFSEICRPSHRCARALQVLGAPRLTSSSSRDNLKGGSAGMATSWMDFHCKQEKEMNG